MYWVAKNSASVITKITRPTGRITAQIAYSGATGAQATGLAVPDDAL